MGASASSSNRFPEIEKYELIEEIGHGGMATVYRARDQRLERDVAVKVIHKHLRENQEVRRRFVSEAKAVAKLRHAGIVEVYDVSDEADQERYLVVELIRGVSLRQLLQDREFLPPEVAATMVAILCDAVEHAHNQGVIHRDIKPENVLIEPPSPSPPSSSADDDDTDETGETGVRQRSDRGSSGASARSARDRVVVKLTDFGIAKVLDAQGVTSTGQILGSPAHMAPEQIEGGAVGPHTDVFALGVLMYECMVGHLPFEGRNPAQVLRRVLEGDFESADTERPAVGGRWARIVAMALANDIDARIGSASELGRLIQDELTALGIDDARGRMIDYFLDEQTYQRETADLLVPRLLERGEAERKLGNVPDAAADFNRALALRPDDLTILKRITSLSAQTVWKERAVRGGVIIVGSLVLGGAAFGVTRLAKSGESTAPSGGATTALSAPESSQLAPSSAPPPMSPDTAVVPEPPAPTPSGAPSASASRPDPVGPGPAPKPGPSADAGAPEPPSGETRPVVFRIFPGSVKVSVGGQRVGNNGRLMLAPGSYTIVAQAKCCKSQKVPLQVSEPDPDKPNAIQTASISLELKPAIVALGGAPPGASLSCPGIGVTVQGGGSQAVPMDQLSKNVQCTFLPITQSTSFTITAGAVNTVAWPK